MKSKKLLLTSMAAVALGGVLAVSASTLSGETQTVHAAETYAQKESISTNVAAKVENGVVYAFAKGQKVAVSGDTEANGDFTPTVADGKLVYVVTIKDNSKVTNFKIKASKSLTDFGGSELGLQAKVEDGAIVYYQILDDGTVGNGIPSENIPLLLVDLADKTAPVDPTPTPNPSDNGGSNSGSTTPTDSTGAEVSVSGVATVTYNGGGSVRLLDKDGHYVNQYIGQGSNWKILASKTINGQLAYRIGNQSQWIPAQYISLTGSNSSSKTGSTSQVTPTGEVAFKGIARVTYTGNGSVRLINAQGKYVDQYIGKRTSWKVFAKKTVNQKTYYRIGNQNQWIPAQYVSVR